MNQIIAKEYRYASIAVDENIVSKRVKGIYNYYNNSYKVDDLWDLVNLFFERECKQNFLEKLVGNFAKEDNTFAEDKIHELQVLAGIILNEICEQDSTDVMFRIIVSINSYTFLGRKPISWAIFTDIQNKYKNVTAKVRDDIVFEYNSISQLPKNINFPAVEESKNYELNSEDINKLSTMVKKINNICTFLNKNYLELMNKNKILYENTELLWWLLDGYSYDEQKDYSELPLQKAAIILGKDLAEIVQCKPGPYMACSLINKAMKEKGKQKETFDSYIDACSDEIIDRLFEKIGDVNDTPILYALGKKRETGEKNWIKAFENKFESAQREYTGIDIANQMYMECLLKKDKN